MSNMMSMHPVHLYNLFHGVLQNAQAQQRQSMGLPSVLPPGDNGVGGSGNHPKPPAATDTTAPAPAGDSGDGGLQNILHMLMGYQTDPNLQNLLKGYGTDPNVTHMIDQYGSNPQVQALMSQLGIGSGNPFATSTNGVPIPPQLVNPPGGVPINPFATSTNGVPIPPGLL